MFLKLVALLLCVVCATCEEFVNTLECVNTTVNSRNIQMEVSGCKSTDERCPLYRGHNHTVIFTFEPTSDFMGNTEFRVYGVFPKFSVPYGRKTDACSPALSVNDNSSCPEHGGFRANSLYKHVSKFVVSKNYPMIQLNVRFLFRDKRSKVNLLCKEVAVQILEEPEACTEEPQESNEA